ncbi:MAG: hypothetical protein M0Z50_12790 [Planctomycetia bacterium]|nr:hypothetical protein [Planctomycetia bacterium]
MAQNEEQLKAEQIAREQRAKEEFQKAEQQKAEQLKREERIKKDELVKAEYRKQEAFKAEQLKTEQQAKHDRSTTAARGSEMVHGGEAPKDFAIGVNVQMMGSKKENLANPVMQNRQDSIRSEAASWERRNQFEHRQNQREFLNADVKQKIEQMTPQQKEELKQDMEARHGRPGQELTDKGVEHFAQQEAHCRAGVEMNRADRDEAAKRAYEQGDTSLLKQQEGLYKMQERPKEQEEEHAKVQQQDHEQERSR